MAPQVKTVHTQHDGVTSDTTNLPSLLGFREKDTHGTFPLTLPTWPG
jgi:hypothetical protein